MLGFSAISPLGLAGESEFDEPSEMYEEARLQLSRVGLPSLVRRDTDSDLDWPRQSEKYCRLQKCNLHNIYYHQKYFLMLGKNLKTV